MNPVDKRIFDKVEEYLKDRKKLEEAHPALTRLFLEWLSADKDASCPICKKRRIAKRITRIVDSGASDQKSLSHDSISKNNNEKVTVSKRLGCLDCVRKHMSQAWVLMTEAPQGYTEHVSLAIERIALAANCLSDNESEVLDKLISIQTTLRESEFKVADEDLFAKHLESAKQMVSELLSSSKTITMSQWKIIGHLGEAADECLPVDRELALKIREERIMMMETPGYVPDFQDLISSANAVAEEENKRNTEAVDAALDSSEDESTDVLAARAFENAMKALSLSMWRSLFKSDAEYELARLKHMKNLLGREMTDDERSIFNEYFNGVPSEIKNKTFVTEAEIDASVE
jgi:hypothetical protein